MNNRRGAEITIGTIIIIILALVVLVVLITGFSQGWGNLWDSITNLGGGSSNVDTIVIACQTACQTNSQFAYCQQERDVKTGDKDKDARLEGKTCNDLVGNADVAGLGFEACPTITCNPSAGQPSGTVAEYQRLCSNQDNENGCKNQVLSVADRSVGCTWTPDTNNPNGGVCEYK